VTQEVWLETRHPGYWVSSLGRVRGRKGHILRPQVKREHHTVNVYTVDGSVKTIYVHILVCETFHGPRPEGMPHTRHLNGDHFDNRAENLRWGTQAENEADKFLHGTAANKWGPCARKA
jgi:hypothetical protein